MNIDAHNLQAAIQSRMRDLAFAPYTPKIGDGTWSKGGVLYMMEQKTERESIIPQSGWWTHSSSLDGLRPCITEHYRVHNRTEFHQNKWMIVVAQLRSDIVSATPRPPHTAYRSLFAVPKVECDNFHAGFSRFHRDRTLNQHSQGSAPSISTLAELEYTDQRSIRIQCAILEIQRDNYFGELPHA